MLKELTIYTAPDSVGKRGAGAVTQQRARSRATAKQSTDAALLRAPSTRDFPMLKGFYYGLTSPSTTRYQRNHRSDARSPDRTNRKRNPVSSHGGHDDPPRRFGRFGSLLVSRYIDSGGIGRQARL